MSDERIHVIATFESQEAMLAGMRRATSWIKIEKAAAVIALSSEPRIKMALVPDHYSEREVELAIEVMRCYADLALGLDPTEELIKRLQKSPPAEAGGQSG
jgi:hypothetical protein